MVYNVALEQRRDWYRQFYKQTGSRINYATQCRELTILRKETDWINKVSITCQQQALRDLDTAYRNFFKGITSYPKPRKKGLNDSFRFQGREVKVSRLNAKWSMARLPKIGAIKFRNTRDLRGKVLNVTVHLKVDCWYVSFACEINHKVKESSKPAVGIDRGVTNTMSLSNGKMLSLPKSIFQLEKKCRRVKKCLSRKKIGSRSYHKERNSLAKLYAKVARIRNDWLHRVSYNLSRQYSVVVLEDLKTKNMTSSAKGSIEKPGKNVKAKSGLNRVILSQGWYSFETMLTYKLEEQGGQLIKVDPRYTSQTCSSCGTVDAKSRKNQATFECIKCGFREHADINAAINILRRSTALTLAEGLHRQPDEARTREV